MLKMILLSTLLLFVSGQALATDDYVIYYHNDALGSPVAATDSAGQVLWKEHYYPYGEKAINDQKSFNEKLGYTGKSFDRSTGLSYYGARYYDPVIGRFMGIDPVGFQEGNVHSFNRYAYANNNPHKFVDPDGRSPDPIHPFRITPQKLTGGCCSAAGLRTTRSVSKTTTKQRSPHEIATNHGGKKVGENKYKFDRKKDAKKAASEISGNLGSNPRTVRRSEYRDSKNTHQQEKSNRVIGKHSSDGKAGYHDHSLGHSKFKESRPHFNSWNSSNGTTPNKNVHLFY